MMMGVLILGASSVGLMFYSPRTASSLTDNRKAPEALAAAREALMGYAVRRGEVNGTARPGELPCPDTNNDGLEEANCNPGTLGRLPWKTLGIPEPKDEAGETLWYAVAGPLRTRPSNASIINSDTRGNIVVRNADGVTQVTNEAAAVIFAPGQALGTQNRTPGQVASCATTGTSVARNLCAANYLENTNGVDNATTNGPFIAAVRSNTYNDRVLFLRTDDYIPSVEMRVGETLKELVRQYRLNSACRCYPWADSWKYSGGIADVHLNRGRFPSRPYPENWGEGAIPDLPQWVDYNDWHNLAWYSAARQETDGAGPTCLFCGASKTLSVGAEQVSALVFTPGPPPPGINRTLSQNINNLAYYLDDAQNNNHGTCPGWTNENANQILNVSPSIPLSCDAYVRPTSTARMRDRIFTVSTTAGSQCAPAARALLENAPCKDGSSDQIKGVCVSHAATLSTCGCSAAAQALTVVPCRNSLNSSNCVAPVAALETCNM